MSSLSSFVVLTIHALSQISIFSPILPREGGKPHIARFLPMANIFIEIVPDLTINVATFLCIPDLLALEATCTALRKFYTSASVDKFLFSPLLNALRVGKCLSPRIEAKLATISSCKTKYRLLVEDSRRDLIDAEELW